MTVATPELRAARLSAPLTDAQFEDIMRLLDAEWWSAGRDRDAARHALDHSQVLIGILDQDDHVRGFLRVLTDFRFFAVILDVVVDGELRGYGLGKRLMNATFAQPDLQDLQGIGLQCEEALKPFYARWGFDDTPGRSGPMKRGFAGTRPGECLVD